MKKTSYMYTLLGDLLKWSASSHRQNWSGLNRDAACQRRLAASARCWVDRMQPTWLGRLVVVSACAYCGLAQTGRMHAVPSPGCGRPPPLDPAVGRGQYLDLEVDGWARGALLRLPTSYVDTTPHPLVLGLHGWTLAGCDAMEEFDLPVESARVIGVFPQGIEDCATNASHCYSSWNGGGCSWQQSSHGSPTCANWTVDPWDGSPGPTSCRAAGRSNRGNATGNGTNCNWCTCVDDVSFLRQVIDMMLLELCVDMSRVYATGESNGGMLLWDLLAQTDRLVAAAPWISAPAKGFLRLPPATASYRPSIMKLFARWDTTIPPDGSVSALGWTFESSESCSRSRPAVQPLLTVAAALAPLANLSARSLVLLLTSLSCLVCQTTM
jgi:poly(3-hydroxybutyrate) depolymerase